MSAWIKMISDKDADEELSEVLNLARTPHGTVDNVMRVHSLRPNTMKGHVTLYRAALHDESNTIPMWFQETVSSYVSILNDCPYSYANHWKNAAYLMQDPTKANQVEIALNTKKPEFLNWKWIKPSKLPEVAVNFKINIYKKISKELSTFIKN